MSQSRKGSAFEAFVNIAVGLVISIIANHLIFPLFGFEPSLSQNITITIIYTAISFIRSYCLRRVFNYFGARV
jgi:hypothetical protein